MSETLTDNPITDQTAVQETTKKKQRKPKANINVSVTFKELCTLEFLCRNKIIKPNNAEQAIVIMTEANEIIAESLNITKDEEAEKQKDMKRKNSSFISRTVMYRILEKQIKQGNIKEGIKEGYATTYYLTLKGVQFYAQLTDVSQEETEKLIEAFEQINGKWGQILDVACKDLVEEE